MIIGQHDTTRAPLLIAEIGNNHEGDAALALELAEAAVEAGAHAVKVQVIDPARLVHSSQSERLAQLGRFRLERHVFLEMAARVRRRGALFIASVFDCDSLRDMQLELDAIKIASGDLDFDPLLEVAAASGRPVILSTGMSTLDEIVHAVGTIEQAGGSVPLAERLAVLHCVSLYPTPLAAANLAAIPRLAERLRVTVGYSDHTLGLEAAAVALALGARIIEKHFTLDRNHSSFRDHALSAEPQELARLAELMRSFDEMRGTGDRTIMADTATRAAARRSIVAARPLAAGTTLSPADLEFVRPGGGLSPVRARTLAGRRLRRALGRHEVIREGDFE